MRFGHSAARSWRIAPMSDLDLVTAQHAVGGSPASGPPGRPFWFSFGSHLVQILFRVGCGRSPLVQYSRGCGSYSVFFALFWLSGYLSAFFAPVGHVWFRHVSDLDQLLPSSFGKTWVGRASSHCPDLVQNCSRSQELPKVEPDGP